MKNYIIKTLNGMAYGLFATLIVGVIIKQLGLLLGMVSFLEPVGNLLSGDLYQLLSSLMGVGIALGIGIILKKDGLLLVMIAIAGAISTAFSVDLINKSLQLKVLYGSGLPGNPLTAYFVTIFTIIIADLIYKKKTPVDILIIPIGVILISLVLTMILSFPANFVTSTISKGLELAIIDIPIPMVMIISVSMGMILTAPISSAAIAIAIGFPPIAAGAAVVGTSIQMIGFAIQSRRDNSIGEMISIGIGTSMLQFKNIVKKPIIWLPTILASAIVAPIVYFLGFISNDYGAGMGTAGLVGPLQSLVEMKFSWQAFLSITIIIVFGGLLVYVFDKMLYVKGLIKKGDLSLKDSLED